MVINHRNKLSREVAESHLLCFRSKCICFLRRDAFSKHMILVLIRVEAAQFKKVFKKVT